MTNCRKVCGGVSIAVGIIFVIIGALLFTIIPSNVLTSTIVNGLSLSSDTNSKSYQDWATTAPDAVPSYHKLYFMNITNPATFAAGVASFSQVGPYVWVYTTTNYDATFANNQVTFSTYRNFTFQRDLSVGDLTDSLTTFNYPYMVGVNSVDGTEASFLPAYFAQVQGSLYNATNPAASPFGTLNGGLYQITTEFLIPYVISNLGTYLNAINANATQAAGWGNSALGLDVGGFIFPLDSSSALSANQANIIYQGIIASKNATLLQGLLVQGPTAALSFVNLVIAQGSGGAVPGVAMTDVLNIRAWALKWAYTAVFSTALPADAKGLPASSMNGTLYTLEFGRGFVTKFAGVSWTQVLTTVYSQAPSVAVGSLLKLVTSGLVPTFDAYATANGATTTGYNLGNCSTILSFLNGINSKAWVATLATRLGAFQASTGIPYQLMGGFMGNLGLKLVINSAYNFPPSPWSISRTVQQLAFGYTDPALGSAVPGILSTENSGVTTQNLGGRDDRDNFYTYVRSNGNTEYSYKGHTWPVAGHSSTQFRPYGPIKNVFIGQAISGGMDLHGPDSYIVWVGAAKVPVFLYLNGTVSISDVKVDRYRFRWNETDIAQYSPPVAAGIFPVFNTTGLYLSQPHFLNLNDPNNSLFIQNITGLNPNEEEHGTHVDVEPITGAAINGHQRLQTSGQVPTSIVSAKLTPGQILPIVWQDQTSTITADKASSLRNVLYGALKLFFGIGLALIIAGGLLVIIGVALVAIPGSQPAHKEEVPGDFYYEMNNAKEDAPASAPAAPAAPAPVAPAAPAPGPSAPPAYSGPSDAPSADTKVDLSEPTTDAKEQDPDAVSVATEESKAEEEPLAHPSQASLVATQ